MCSDEGRNLKGWVIESSCISFVRFILDDSALYLSDKCESEAVDLRRGRTCMLKIPPRNGGLVSDIEDVSHIYACFSLLVTSVCMC